MQRNHSFERMQERLTAKKLLAFDKEVNEGVAKTPSATDESSVVAQKFVDKVQ
jgi:hypothetical protein